MSGLILLVVILVWFTFVSFITIGIAKALPANKWKPIFVIGIFLIGLSIPVMDELIALPEMNQLCEKAKKIEYDPGIAYGKTAVDMTAESEYRTFFSGVKVLIDKTDYIDKNSLVILSTYRIKPLGGNFSIPVGSGDRITWILRECSLDMTEKEILEFYNSNKIEIKF